MAERRDREGDRSAWRARPVAERDYQREHGDDDEQRVGERPARGKHAEPQASGLSMRSGRTAPTAITIAAASVGRERHASR